MPFTFEVKTVTHLPRAQTAVISGELIDGAIRTGASAEVEHQGARLPLKVKGVLNDGTYRENKLSISTALWQPAAQNVAPGDIIYGH